ncbi:hypothetical protein TESG_00732 [Trichophyton tonsurans CBS 112818]|uniref:Uncharacterized protein n=1 Tax=Trichophyton tonsurans (strain CBS 112818) TaxID=647933 RepID=F2RPC3_TRIT1|nr:hypothetical protein TESG_00732 [Trichophyton tonsurans CBS 112818]
MSNDQTTQSEQRAHGMTRGEERIVPCPSIHFAQVIFHMSGFPDVEERASESREGKATTVPQPVALQHLQEECTDSKAANGLCRDPMIN